MNQNLLDQKNQRDFEKGVKWLDNLAEVSEYLKKGKKLSENKRLYNWYNNQKNKVKKEKLDPFYLKMAREKGVDLNPVPAYFKKDLLTLKGYLVHDLPLNEIPGLPMFYNNLKNNYRRNKVSIEKLQFMAKVNFTFREEKDIDGIVDDLLSGVAFKAFAFMSIYYEDIFPHSAVNEKWGEEVSETCDEIVYSKPNTHIIKEVTYLHSKLTSKEKLEVIVKMFRKVIDNDYILDKESSNEAWYIIADSKLSINDEDYNFLEYVFMMYGLDAYEEFPNFF